MSKLKIGDRVMVIGNTNDYHYAEIGSVGTVCGFSDGDICVSFEIENSEFHACFGKCKDNHGQFISDCDLELVNQQKIIITVDDNTTLARLYDGKNLVKSATAKCSPSDEFNFTVGADLAYQRLMHPATVEKNPSEEEMRKARLKQLLNICGMGACINSAHRKHDCPFYNMERGGFTCYKYAATHPETQKIMDDYLAAEGLR